MLLSEPFEFLSRHSTLFVFFVRASKQKKNHVSKRIRILCLFAFSLSAFTILKTFNAENKNNCVDYGEGVIERRVNFK